MSNGHVNHYEVKKLSWREKWRRWWFPRKRCPLPESVSEEIVAFEGVIRVTAAFRLSWWERVKILFSGVFIVETKTATEFEHGRIAVTHAAYVGCFAYAREIVSAADRDANVQFAKENGGTVQ